MVEAFSLDQARLLERRAPCRQTRCNQAGGGENQMTAKRDTSALDLAAQIAAAVEWEASPVGQEEMAFWDALTEAAWADLPEWTGPDLTEPAEDPVAETVPAEPPLPPGY
jgi:hypothetical protein